MRSKAALADLQRGLALAVHTLQVDPQYAERFLRTSSAAEPVDRRARVTWLAEELLWMRQVVEKEILV